MPVVPDTRSPGRRLFAAAIYSALLFFGLSSFAFSEEIRIGVIAPLTGGLAPRGQDIQRTLEVLVPMLNQAGGRHHFTYQIEDGKCGIGSSATTAATKLIQIDRVHFLITGCSGETLQVGPLAERSQVPLIAVLSNHHKVSTLGEYVFRMFASNQDFIEKLAACMSGHLPTAVISEENAFTLAFAELFRQKLAGQIAVDVDYANDTSDFRTLITRLKGANPKSVFANCASASTCAALVSQFRQMNLTIPIYGFYFLMEPAVIESARGAEEGIIAMDLPRREGGPVLYQKMYEELIRRYPEGPSLELLVRIVFDAMLLMRSAAEDVGTDASAIKDYFYRYNEQGASGQIRFDRAGDLIGLSHVPRTISGGRPRDVSCRAN